MAQTIGRHIRIGEDTHWRCIEALANARSTSPNRPNQLLVALAIETLDRGSDPEPGRQSPRGSR